MRLEDGTKVSETVIAASVPGLTSSTKIAFDPLIQVNRPALLIEDNILYIAFGSHCDEKNYHGWVFAYDVSSPKTPKKLAELFGGRNGLYIALAIAVLMNFFGYFFSDKVALSMYSMSHWNGKRTGSVRALIQHQDSHFLDGFVEGVILGEGQALLHRRVTLLARQVNIQRR